MKKTNKFGLSRNIPAKVKREVRRRCKFGCVICRSGFYQYEHIDPFENVSSHDPARICCLCGSCHDSVTRGQLSKAAVDTAYKQIWQAPPANVPPPIGPLDFHTGSANLLIGGLLYSPAVKSVLRYYETDLIKVEPGSGDSPGSISAVFFDDEGKEIFYLDKNEWIGDSSNWDIEVVGPRLTVRNPKGRVVLALRLDPPGNIVIERLDMRFGNSHLLASESSYAAGVYTEGNQIFWYYAKIIITRATPNAVGIEFLDPLELETRAEALKGVGQYMESADRNFIIGSPIGAIFRPLGISIGYGCAINLYETVAVSLPIDTARNYVWHDQNGLRAAYERPKNNSSKAIPYA